MSDVIHGPRGDKGSRLSSRELICPEESEQGLVERTHCGLGPCGFEIPRAEEDGCPRSHPPLGTSEKCEKRDSLFRPFRQIPSFGEQAWESPLEELGFGLCGDKRTHILPLPEDKTETRGPWRKMRDNSPHAQLRPREPEEPMVPQTPRFPVRFGEIWPQRTAHNPIRVRWEIGKFGHRGGSGRRAPCGKRRGMSSQGRLQVLEVREEVPCRCSHRRRVGQKGMLGEAQIQSRRRRHPRWASPHNSCVWKMRIGPTVLFPRPRSETPGIQKIPMNGPQMVRCAFGSWSLHLRPSIEIPF